MPVDRLEPTEQWAEPTPVRVLVGSIRRIVMKRIAGLRLQPGTLFYRTGRRVAFVSVHPGRDCLRLLLSNGTLNVKLAEIAEVHFPRIDPWDAYFRELRILSPTCRSRLVRLETTDGLIATASELRFHAEPYQSLEHHQRAEASIERLDRSVERLQKQVEQRQKRFEKAHSDYARQLEEIDKKLKSAGLAYENAKDELKRRSDRQAKTDADEMARRSQKIDREFKSADQAMINRLRPEKPEKRDSMLKAFRLRQSQLRREQEKSLETERLRREQQRIDLFARLEAYELQKLQQAETDHRYRSGHLKAWLGNTAVQWHKQLANYEKYRSQRDAAVRAHRGSGSWRHIIQPAWSLDPLWVPFGKISTRWSFPPDRVPLSRIHPASSVSPPLQPWSLNRNSHGGLLCSGRREHGWGFGVHAYSELAFALPPSATSFRSGLGLDDSVDTGGCVRAQVLLESAAGEKPLYSSGLLIGSQKTVDTGSIAIPSSADRARKLVLQADTAHRDRPPGADPLNIRDKLNWLGPVIGLDSTELRDAVNGETVDKQHVWRGWSVKLDKRGQYDWVGRFRKNRSTARGEFSRMIRTEKYPLVLSRTVTVGPGDNWLIVDAEELSDNGTSGPAKLSVRIDGKKTEPPATPARMAWWNGNAPTAFPLEQYRRRKVTLELIQPAGGGPVSWKSLGMSKELPREYRFARGLKRIMALREAKPEPAKWGKDAQNILKSADVAKDVTRGHWERLEGQLLSDVRTYSRCQLPVEVEGDYQFEVQFTRMSGDCMAVMLPVGRTSALLVVSGWGGEVSGLAFIDRKDANENATTRNGTLKNGVKHTVLITTRLLDKDRASIDVTLDGKPYIKWAGSVSSLRPDSAWRLQNRKYFGIGAYEAIIVFHSCQFRTLGDKNNGVRQ